MKSAGLKGAKTSAFKFSVRFVATVRRKNSKPGPCALLVNGCGTSARGCMLQWSGLGRLTCTPV
jgi:hypothetical protein